jgi:hypothetical protein
LHHLQEAHLALPTKSQAGCDAVRQIGAACENLRGIVWYMRSIAEILEECSPEASLGTLRRFYSEVVDVFMMRFGDFVFQFYVPGLVQLGEFDAALKQVKWFMSKAMTEQHTFVETWRNAAKAFGETIAELRMDQARKNELWFALWQYTSWLTLNAIAAASRSNGHGKTSMKFNFTNIYEGLSRGIDAEEDSGRLKMGHGFRPGFRY